MNPGLHCSCFIATSVDGYVAGSLGEIDWLFASGEYGYEAYLTKVDVVIMGRATYETCVGRGDWPYVGKRAIVLTNRPVAALPDVEYRSGDVQELVERLEEDGAQHLSVIGGGDIVSQFRRIGRIDEWIISMHPIVLGMGLPLFHAGFPRSLVELVRCQAFPSGLVQLHYRSVPTFTTVA